MMHEYRINSIMFAGEEPMFKIIGYELNTDPKDPPMYVIENIDKNDRFCGTVHRMIPEVAIRHFRVVWGKHFDEGLFTI